MRPVSITSRRIRLIIYSLWVFLATSWVISLTSAGAVARPEQTAGTPGKYLRILKSPDQQSVLRGDSATFTIVVLNTSEQVDLTGVVVKDLFAPDCNRDIGNLPADSNFPPYQCTLNNVQEPVANWIAVEGINPISGEVDLAVDTAVVDVIDISVAVDAVPVDMQRPGGEIEFSVNISNTGSVTVGLKSLTSIPFGNLTNLENQLVTDNSCPPGSNLPLLPPNTGVECKFKAELVGEAGRIPVEVSARAEDSGSKSIAEKDVIHITISDPVKHHVHIPLVVDLLDEPNDTCSSAFPLSINHPYYFLPDDGDDWYFFDLNRAGNVLVELINFVPRLGQIIVYDGGQCNTLQILRNNGNDNETKLVPLGIQPPGRYYILVINDGATNVKERYQLQIQFQQS